MTALVAAVGVTIAALGDLTVPADRLPAGCALPRSAVERVNANQFRGGLWAGLPMARNPTISSEPQLIVEVRERIEGPRLLPDAPLTARDAARFRMKLADGIEEAYAATYRQSDSFQVIVVYGLRFPSARAAEEFWSGTAAARTPHSAAILSGAIVAVVSAGPPAACLDAVAAHVRSLRE